MTTRVALLGRDDAVRATLRTALVDAGAELAFEGDLNGADADAIRASVAKILIINLEPGTDAELNALDPLIDDPAIDVLFNEAEVTGQLAGWDLARWARHLVAKVLGHGDATPPPPPGAEMLPERNFMPRPGAPKTPEQEVGDSNIADFHDEAHASLGDLPESTLPDALATSPQAAAEPEALPEPADDTALPRLQRDAPIAAALETAARTDDGEFSFDLGEIEGALSSISSSAPAASSPAPESAVGSSDDDHGGLDLGADFDLGAMDFGTDAAVEHAGATTGAASAGEAMDIDFSEIEASLAGIQADEIAPRSDEAVDLGMGLDLDFDLNADGSSALPSLDDSGASLDLDADADFAALAAQFDAQSSGDSGLPAADAGGLDFALEDMALDSGPSDAAAGLDALLAAAPAERPAAEPVKAATPAPAASAAKESFGALSLTDMSDEATPEPPAAGKPAKSSFDFSSLSLSLEPLADAEAEQAAPAAAAAPRAQAPAVDLGGSSLSLESLDGEDAAPVAAATAAPVQGIPHVFVLGASIGGPDALRTFLAHIPADFPALFVLAQHLDNGFFTRLAQQLQKTSKMLIRVADDNQGPATVGQLLVVTSEARFRFDREGGIHQLPYEQPPHYKPCIDDLFKEAADSFGKDVTAIIFSGMAGDAVEGASYVTAKGGEVWVQDPGSCVVSSMVDGARSRGVVEYSGSPRELAERCVARFGRG